MNVALPLSSRPSSSSPTRSGGFTLVEVALAIGIVAFAFVALLALLPAGNTAYRRAIDLAVAGQIGQRLMNEAEQTDFKALIDRTDEAAQANDPDNFTFRAPKRDTPLFRYFDDQGREVIPKSGDKLAAEEKLRVIYQVNTRIMPNASAPPLSATASSNNKEGNLAQVTIQVAHNPSILEIPMSSADAASTDPNRNLWVPTAKQAGVSIYTYSGLVGRND